MTCAKKTMELGVLAMLRPDTNPFEVLARYGVKTAQVQNWDMANLTESYAATVRRQMADAGIRPAALWAGYSGRIAWNFIDGSDTCGLVPPDLRTRRVDELKRGADFARWLGAPAIITHCGFIPENPRDPQYSPTVNAIYDVAWHCHELGIGFWFEAGQETPVTLLRTLQDVGLPNLGVNLDTANLILYGRGNPVDALDVIGPYVRNLHVKDGLFPTDGYHLGREVPVGEGRVDFETVIRKLYTLNFTGELIIEREISGPQQAEDILKAIRYIDGLIRRCQP